VIVGLLLRDVVQSLIPVIILAWVAGRLLGVRQSLPKALLAGFLGWSAGNGLIAIEIAYGSAGPSVLTGPGAFVAALILTMALSVLFELIGRPGSLGRVQAGVSGIPRPIAALRRRVSRGRRYLQITRIAVRHGLAPALGLARPERGDVAGREDGTSFGRSLRLALQEAGGIFVKLGQVLSARPDLLPPDVIEELSRLQDAVPPEPAAVTETLLVEELGAPPDHVFARFEPEVVAAASIAQVHRAWLPDGGTVAVKVQRARVRRLVERDLDILLQLATTIEARTDWGRKAGVVDLARGFSEAVLEELDFHVEARNVAAVAEAMGADSPVRLPGVHAELSTSRVLVSDWLDGVNVRDAGPLLVELGADRPELARQLLRCFLRQILGDGVFHADPHPGNVMVLRDGRLALIDFGSVGRLAGREQSALRQVLVALERREAGLLRDAILEVAERRTTGDEDLLERALAQFMARRLGPGMVPGAGMLNDLFRLMMDFGLTFPPQVAATFRSLITLEGTLALLAPGFQIVAEARAQAAEWMYEAFASRAPADELVDLVPLLRRLPRRVDRIAAALESGQFKAGVRLFADEQDARVISRLVDRAVLALLGVGAGVISVLLLESRTGPALTSSLSLLQALGYLGLFSSATLIMRVVIAILRERST
jgi:ubiquinone biosynthesis protein